MKLKNERTLCIDWTSDCLQVAMTFIYYLLFSEKKTLNTRNTQAVSEFNIERNLEKLFWGKESNETIHFFNAMGWGGTFASLPAWKGGFVFYISWYSIQWENGTTFWAWNGAIRDFFQILCGRCRHPLTIKICHPWIFLCGRLMYWERKCKCYINKQMLLLHH